MKKRLLIIFMCVLIILPTFTVHAIQTSPFSDLDVNHWAYKAVTDMVNKGIIQGFPDGTFRPNDPVTREQFAKLLVLAMEIPLKTPSKPTFADVTQNDWAYPYVEACANYLTGYKSGNKFYFKGKEKAVREDMAVAIVVAKGLQKQKPDYSFLDAFADKSKISPNLRDYVTIAAQFKIMEGDGKNFNPLGNLTRAEACVLIYKSSLAAGDNKVPANGIDNTNYADYRLIEGEYYLFNVPYGFAPDIDFDYKPSFEIIYYSNLYDITFTVDWVPRQDVLSLYGSSSTDDSYDSIVNAIKKYCETSGDTIEIYNGKPLVAFMEKEETGYYSKTFYTKAFWNSYILVIKVSTNKYWQDIS